MGKLKNKFIISFLIIFFLAGSLMIISSAAVLGSEHVEDLAAEKSEKLMEEILADYQSILSSTPNVTPATQLLAALPEREDKPAVAVYSIADRTGQIKEEGSAVVTQGAITEYQVDRNTGGLGLNIGGLGGTREYAVATTAVDIRVLDSTTGEVVWSESLKGKIEGERVGVQAFSFMGNNIVEFETGRGKQEVINLVVRTLLEEAVFKIYQQGVI